MNRSSLVTRLTTAVLLAVSVVACGESPTAPTSDAAALPRLHDRALMPPSMAPLYPYLSTSPCAANGDVGEPMLAIGAGDLDVSTLPTPAGNGRVMAVNNSGVAVGYSVVGGMNVAYKWTPSGGGYIATALGSPFGVSGTAASGEAWGINNAGDIVGYARQASGAQRAVVWPGGAPGGVALASYTVAPFTLASAAKAINDAGTIVGYAVGLSGSSVLFRAMIFTTATATPVPGSGAYARSVANGINAAGDIAGEVSTGNATPFLTARNLAGVGSWELLSAPASFDRGSGQDINSFKRTAGYSQKLPTNTGDRGVEWTPTAPFVLDTLSVPAEGPSISSYAYGISSPANVADERIVGFTSLTSGSRRATMWQPGADPLDLGKPVGACGSQATTIADNGEYVCGFGYFPGYELPACWEIVYPPVLESFVVGDATCDAPATVSATFTSKTASAGPWHYVISWGDGSVTEGDAASPGTIDASHDYAASGSYPVKVTITDENGKSVTSDVKTITKAPCPPELTVVATKASYVCDEPGAINASFTSSSASAGPFAYTIDWGDGSAPTTGSVANAGSIPASHSYAVGAGTYTVTVTVTNVYGESDTATTTIVKVPCTVDVTSFVSTKASYACDESASVTATFTSNSPTAAPFTYAITWGDGATENGTTMSAGSITKGHDYAAAGSYTVTVVVTDQYGNSDSETLTVVKEECVPVITQVVAPVANCVQASTITASFTSSADAGPYAYTIAWGDGSAPTTGSAAAPGDISASHDYAPGTYTATVTVTNKFGQSATSTVSVTKETCVPVITTFLASKALYACDEPATVTASFTSSADAGPYAWVITWGDGQTTTGSAAAPGSITSTHAYAANGSYTVKVEVTNSLGDKAESTTQVNVDTCAPDLTALNITAITVCNQKALLTGTFTAKSNPGPFTANVTWGDGQSETIAVTPGTQFSLEHAYGANGTYAVTVTVQDADGKSDATTVETLKDCRGAVCTYTIGYWKNHQWNWPTGYTPSMKFLSTGTGAVTWLTALSQPTKGNAFWILARQWAGAKLNVAGGAPTRSDVQTALTYGEMWLRANLNADGSPKLVGEATTAGAQAIALARVLDEFNNGLRGTPHCDSTGGEEPPVDTPPEIVKLVLANANLACAQKASLTASFTADAIDGPWTYTIAWGDGSSSTGTSTPGANILATHEYVKNGTFTIVFTVEDKDGDTASKTVTITMNCPEYNFEITRLSLTDASIKCTEKAYLSAAFTGVATDGPFTYSLTWGDGSAAETGALAPNSTFNASHTYAAAGTFTVTFAVTNKYGRTINKKELVVVECPTTTGCTYTQGYWKNHPTKWPAGFSASGKYLSTGSKAITWLASMSTPTSGNNFYLLSQQWTAAKLNAAKGAYVRPDVATAIAQAEALLKKYIAANGSVGTIKSTSADGAEAVRLATILDEYNNGKRGTPHCG